MKKIIAGLLAAALVTTGLGSLAYAQEEPVNEVSVNFHTAWTYNPSGDTFTNGEVTGSKSWHTHIWNDPDETGAEVVALALSLDSELEFYPYQGENLVTLGPPTYEWFFGNVAEGAGEDDTHVGFTIPDVFPVTFTPGFDASRVADKTEFLQSEGTQTQNLTITMTPWEVTEGFNISVAVYEDGLVDAVINPPTGEDDFDLSPDGHWLDIWPRDLEIGTTYTYNVTIEVTPQVPGVEFMPMVHVKCYESSLAYGTTSGSSVSYPAGDPADEIGTWTWSAEGSYEWHWDEGVNRCVGWDQHCWENYLFAHFKSSYSYTPPGDSFTNQEVTGSRGWDTHIQNRLYATGETLTNVSLSLDSDLTFDHVFGSENLVTMGPPTYEWSFPEIPVELLENVGVAFETSTWPVTYTPGFDASRMVDVTEFEGPSTQTITITVTPREAMDTIGMNVIATKEDWVNPVITSCRLEDSTDGSAGDNFRFNLFPDGHQLSMWQKEPVVDNEYTYVVTIEVTPKASKVEFLPFVGVQNMPNHPITPADTGSSATYTVDGIGTWTWSTEGSYSWGVATGEPFLAVEWGPRSSDLTNYISVTFNNIWRYLVTEDTFLNQEVTGSKSMWVAEMNNSEDGSGEPVNGVTLSLWSPLAFDDVWQGNLAAMGPPTYEWSFGDMPQGSNAHAHAGFSFENPSSMPVTFTLGLDASRVLDRTYFWQSEGTQTQNLTITVTPREEVPTLDTRVIIPQNDLVDAVITSPTGGEGVSLSPDGRNLHLHMEGLEVDTTYTFTVTIEVTPHVPYVEFTPLVNIARVPSMPAHVVTGNSLSYTVYDMGTWTWNTEGDYGWYGTEMITRALVWEPSILDLTNNVSWEYITWWGYTPAEDTFTNSEVTGRTWWQANVDNRGDATGEPITGLELMLNSELALDWNPVCLVDVTPISEEPPTYQWSFSDVAEQDTAGVWVKPENPDQFPATFTPGFDATRSADITQFLQSDGTQTQTLTIEVTPQEVTEWLIIFVAADENLLGIPIDENDLVEAVITAPPSGADLIPDGHLMIMQVPAGEVGVPTTFTITIEVTPKVPRVEYMPAVWVATPDELIGSGPFSGSSHSRTVDLLGTWTWNATGDYAGSWAEAVFGAVTFPGIQPGIEDFAIKSMFIDFDRRPRLDEIAVTKATFSLREGATYDLAVDDVIVNIDGVEIVIPAGSFRKMGLLGGEKYIYNSPRGVKPKILMVLNFDDGEWSLLAHDIDASAVNNYDGVDVAFSIGYMSAIENVNMRLGGLSYIAED